jgi:hypothetical protein
LRFRQDADIIRANGIDVKTGGLTMKTGKIIYLMASVGLFALSGCGSEVQVASPEPLCVGSMRKAQLMEVCEDILVRKQFVIEKYDVGNGYIKTRPLSGKQMFEFWKSDNAGSFNSAESGIQSIQRSVIINILESENQLCIDCDVNVQRLSIPEQEIWGMEQTAGMFTHSKRSLQRLRLRLKNEQKEDMAIAWIDLGPDGALEKVILEQIEKKINKLEDRK